MVHKLRIAGVCFLLVSFVFGCTPVSYRPQDNVPLMQTTANLKKLCQQHNIDWYWDSLAQVATIKLPQGDARILIGSEIVVTDEEQIWLSAPVIMENSNVVVPPDFTEKVIERYKTSSIDERDDKDYSITNVTRVVVDAGHGGKDPGAIGVSGIQEKGVVLDIAKRLEKELKKKGIEVIMTRDSDEFISLAKRTEIASAANADLFISIHANASPDRSVHGVEVFSLKDLGYFEQNEEQMLINEEITCKHLNMEINKNTKKTVVDMIRSRKKADSIRLATHSSKYMVGLAKARDRGLKQAKFYVLRNTLIPSVLVEVGFLTHSKEERNLNNPAYRQKVAESLALSISAYAKN